MRGGDKKVLRLRVDLCTEIKSTPPRRRATQEPTQQLHKNNNVQDSDYYAQIYI